MTQKKHLFPRWHELSEHERIVNLICYMTLAIVTMIGMLVLFSSNVEVACSTGDIDLHMEFNQSMDITNLSISGVDDMRCSFKLPVYILLGGW